MYYWWKNQSALVKVTLVGRLPEVNFSVNALVNEDVSEIFSCQNSEQLEQCCSTTMILTTHTTLFDVKSHEVAVEMTGCDHG